MLTTKGMRMVLLTAVAAIAGALVTPGSARADQLIFTDTLTTSTWHTDGNVNDELATRQAGGIVTGVSYSADFDGGGASDIQTGRPAGSPQDGMYFEKVGQAAGQQRYVSPNHNFNTLVQPFWIRFDHVGDSVDNGGATGDRSYWNGISILGSAATQTVVPFAAAPMFGFIWMGDGNYQVFATNNGIPIEVGDFGQTISSIAFFVHDGSFGGAPFLVDIYLNDTFLTTRVYASSDNYITFGGSFANTTTNVFEWVAYRNLSITTVPAPAALPAGIAGVGLLALRRRRR